MALVQPPRRVGEKLEATDLEAGTLPEELRAPLAEYFRAAPMIVAAPMMVANPFREGKVIPVGFQTDGTWVWESAWAIFAGDEGVSPPQEFIEHAAAAGYVPARPEGPELTRIGVAAGLMPPTAR